jgi:hypothetical protein
MGAPSIPQLHRGMGGKAQNQTVKDLESELSFHNNPRGIRAGCFFLPFFARSFAI